MRRPGQFRIADCRLPIGDQVGCGLRTYLLVQFFANYAHWRGMATGQTLNKFDAVSFIGTNSDRIMHFFAPSRPPDPQTRAQILHQFQTTSHRTTERATDPDMSFSGGMPAEHWIKSDYLQNVDRLEPEFFRDPERGFVADEPEVFLPQMQERHHRAATMVAWITRNRRVRCLLQFSGNLDTRRVCHR